MISCVEEFRADLQGLSLIALAADPDADDRQAATVALGLEPEVEPDQRGAEPGRTACSWCGRSDPEGGLTPDYPRPAPPLPAVDPRTGQDMPVPAPKPVSVDNSTDMHCADEQACQAAREQRQWYWVDSQFRTWQLDWAKYQEVLAYQQQQAARTRFGGGIYALTADEEPSPQFTAALEQVRLAVEHRLDDYAAAAEVTLAAPAVTRSPPAVPLVPARLCADHQCDHRTMRCPDNRTHTLGHHRQHPHVHDAASALGRKAVLARR